VVISNVASAAAAPAASRTIKTSPKPDLFRDVAIEPRIPSSILDEPTGYDADAAITNALARRHPATLW
jgi:hypothetical protein